MARLSPHQLQFDKRLDSLVAKWLPIPPHDVLYHYTTWNGLRGIVSSKRFRATAHDCTNDPGELLTADGDVLAVARSYSSGAHLICAPLLTRFLQDFESKKVPRKLTVYLACFTQARDKLSQWRDYGAKGTGVCLGVRVLRDDGPMPDDGFGRAIVQVSYSAEDWRESILRSFGAILKDHQRFMLKYPADRRWADHVALSAMFRVAAYAGISAKTLDWKEEEEWRYVVLPAVHTNIGPHENVDDKCRRFVAPVMRPESRLLVLDEVIIGPDQPQGFEAARAEAISILQNAGYPHVSAPMPDVNSSVFTKDDLNALLPNPALNAGKARTSL